MLTAHKLSLAIGSTALLDAVDFGIEAGERVCLVGRNGSGKSTLLRVMAGEVALDGGEIRHAPGLRIATLPQDNALPPGRSVFDIVADGLGALGSQLAEYHRLVREAPDDLAGLARAQQVIEAQGGWTLDAQVEAVLSRMGLDGDARAEALSGGQRRRVWLARALVGEPELLLLDEPTNHLDIEAIQWLEDFLRDWPGTVLFVTHDRAFLRRVATRILELDRGALSSWPGDYDNYLRRKDEQLHAEALERARVDRKLAQEEVWIRQGIKARRTRNEGRVRALQQLRAEVAARRDRQGEVRLQVAEAERSGRLVSEATELHFAWGDQPVVRGLSTTLMRGDRVGLIGPNGAGKTTLLRLLLGQLAPDRGSVRLGTRLQIAYFDQMRAALDPERSVADSISDGRDFVELGDARRHVMTYLQDFLFTPDRARSPVRSLSGGEASRLLLARLFAQPSNLLVLDEPTNDLDIETLELLEERLAEYQGTVLLVSHDRDFLDRVVTRSLVFEGQGRVLDLVGGFSDWQAWRVRSARDAVPPGPPPRKTTPTVQPSAAQAAPKRDARAIRRVTRRIEQLEAEQEALSNELADGAIYRDDAERAGQVQKRLSTVAAELEAAYAEWESLEA